MWVDVEGLRAGSDFLNKIGQAIVDAKVGLTRVHHCHILYIMHHVITWLNKGQRILFKSIIIVVSPWWQLWDMKVANYMGINHTLFIYLWQPTTPWQEVPFHIIIPCFHQLSQCYTKDNTSTGIYVSHR